MQDFNTDISSGQPWFVAQLKPNGFITAKLNLQKQGYRTFMPMRETEVRHARKSKTVTRPLFPGYIFVTFDPDITQWRAINNTFGVKKLITRDSNSPQIVPPTLMLSLKSRCGEDDLVLPQETFEPGNIVRVVSGPFKDIVAKVESLSDGERVAVLLDLMGRAARVEFTRDILEITVAQ